MRHRSLGTLTAKYRQIGTVSAAGQRGTERWNRLQFALQELQLWINITQTVGRVSTGTFRISKVEGEGLAGTAFPLDDF